MIYDNMLKQIIEGDFIKTYCYYVPILLKIFKYNFKTNVKIKWLQNKTEPFN